ncbi:Pentatricopeptide repeat (PPR) superfamily protein [Euphorbia peplus]|nr:Pentatricopeptide repeat (PPR) superfamily protein [Euphorbia peplus]
MPPNQHTLMLFRLVTYRNFSETIPLSPELLNLPTRLVEVETPDLTKQNDDDLVVPSLANWIESRNPIDNRLFTKPNTLYIDKLTQTLKKHHSSMDSQFHVLNECGINATNDSILQLLNRYNDDWVLSFRVFTWAKDQTGYVHSPELYNFMIDILGKHKKFSFMWDLVEEMMSFKGYVSIDTMSTVMTRLAAAGKYKSTIEAFRGLNKFGLSKDIVALNALMDALVKGGSVEQARNVFMEFKDCMVLNHQSFDILIRGYCKVGKLDDGRKIMAEMEKHGFQPGVGTYTCFIEFYGELKDFRSVNATLKEMEENGCKPNLITYTVMVRSLGKAEQIDDALEVYEKMKMNELIPDGAFYMSLISILSKSGRIDDAWDVFEDMEEQGVGKDVLIYNTMVSCACAHMQEENALKLLRRMEEGECKPNVKTYAPLLRLCCKMKRIKVLMFLLDHMYKNNVCIDLSTYAVLVRGLCSSGKIELACSFFEEAMSKGMIPYDSTYKILLEALRKSNMTESMVRIQKLMEQMNQ